MTADRRADRRLARVQHASPYSQKTRNAKPSQQSKKSFGWSLAGFLSYFNPLRSRHSEEPEEETEEEISQDELDTNQSSQSSHDVFGPRTQPAQPPPPPAARPPDFFINGPSPPAGPSFPQLTTLPESSTSPHKNIDAVKTYLEQSEGRPLNPVEIAGLVSMLQDSIDGADDDTQQPFRFSKSPSRADSPATSSLFPTASSSTISPTTETPKTPARTLSKNPNGAYRWQGAGSARRNRYHSPAFGSPSSGNKIKLPPAETAKSDSKRRRVGQDAETSSPQKSSASRRSSAEPTTAGPPATASTSVPNVKDVAANGPPQSKPPVNGINTSASRLNKPTTPAVSSPLRQAWGQDDLPSPNSSPTSAPKTSRAAAFMTELIREATPPKKPDIANPYQTASPVKTLKPPAKKPARKPRAVSRQLSSEEKEKQPEISIQAIIEATLPKGSKRSRPPVRLSASANGSSETGSINSPSQSPSPPPRQSSVPSFQNGSSTALNGSKTVTIEEVEDEEELPLPKKQKRAPAPTEPTIVEIDDLPPPSQPFLRPSEVIEPGDPPQLQTTGLNGASPSSAPTISPTATGRSFFNLKSSAPKEPSKLRFSIKADRDETASSASSVSPTTAISPKDAKAEVLSITVSELPSETFTLPERTIREGRSSGELRAEREVRGFADEDTSMDDAWCLSSISAGPSNANKVGPSTSTTTLPTPTSTSTPPFASSTTTIPPTTNGGFNWGAAGMKPPPRQEDGWKCGTCDLMNLTSVTEKCAVCDAPKPGVTKPVVSSSFSMPKPPSTPPLFGTNSTAANTTAFTATTSSSPGGFDWGAAGVKPLRTNTEGWKCGTCDLVNPASATKKCTVCEAPKPGAEKSSAVPSFSMPKPPSTPLTWNPGSTSTTTTATSTGGFNWGAAGLKPPTTDTEGWKCGTCDLMNPASAKEKCNVCDTPKPGASSPSSGSGNTISMPTPPSGPVVFGAYNPTSSPSATSSGFSFGVPKPAESMFNARSGPAPSTTTTTTATSDSGTGGGFNWGAAGLKQPSESGGWKCKICDLMNPTSATDKCRVCEAPKS